MQSRNSILYSIIGIVIILAVLAALYTGQFGPPSVTKLVESSAVKAEPESDGEQSTPRLLFAQIVDTEPKDVFQERAILEGRPFKYLLKQAALSTCTKLRAATDDQILFEHLSDEAHLHRGKAYTPGRGVVVEVARVELDKSYGFPPGWSVLPAVYINTAREIYALRFICPPDSTLYERLKEGISKDSLPVINLSGLFFKNYARMTSDPKEKPWIRPLLVCPEPEFPAKAEPRQVMKELQEAGFGHLLPSQRIEATGAEERLVLEMLGEKGSNKHTFRAFGETGDLVTVVKKSLEKLKQRLPAEHAQKPSVIVLLKGLLPADPRVSETISTLKANAIDRVSIHQDFSK